MYALKGDPGKAYDFFRPLSGDSGVDSERTFKMMEDLGQNLKRVGLPGVAPDIARRDVVPAPRRLAHAGITHGDGAGGELRRLIGPCAHNVGLAWQRAVILFGQRL